MDRQPVEGKANTSPTRSAEPITSTGSQSLCAPPCLEFGRGFDCVNGNRTDGRLEHMSWTNLKAKTRKASGSNIMIPQCSALIRTFPQLHYRRGLNLAAIPPPIFMPNCVCSWAFFFNSRVSARVHANSCGLRRPARSPKNACFYSLLAVFLSDMAFPKWPEVRKGYRRLIY